MRLLWLLFALCFVVLVSAQKAVEENVDPVEVESREHSAKKYTKDHQKPHHHAHKHKKQHPPKDQVKPKKIAAEIPEPDLELQADVETSRHAVDDRRRKDQLQDLHLQDLSYEEALNKEKAKKKGHHQKTETLDAPKEDKLFADQETKEDKVIEDSFTPLKENVKKSKPKNGKGKKKNDQYKNKNNKDTKNGKSKNGKKKNKNDKHKNKDRL